MAEASRRPRGARAGRESPGRQGQDRRRAAGQRAPTRTTGSQGTSGARSRLLGGGGKLADSRPQGRAIYRRVGRGRGKTAHTSLGAVRLFVAICVAVLLALTAGGAAAYAALSGPPPAPADLTARRGFQSTRIYDRNGVLLHEAYDPDRGRRVAVPLAQMPAALKRAFLAAEDARFYEHPGVDVRATLRALVGDVFGDLFGSRKQLQGGSTITQQLVKNALLTDDQTVSRKLREAVLAIQITRHYSKDQILELYLNSVYLGNQAYGVEAAAQTYFGKPVQELSTAEAALLAGLPRSPSTTNPFADLQAAKAEQRRVLAAMVRQGFLGEAEAAEAEAQPLQYRESAVAERAPHFVAWVQEQLGANPKYGRQALYERGLEVTTTLDVRLQQVAERIVKDQVSRLGAYNVHDGALVAMNPATGEILALVAMNPATGEILAMVGSADFANKDIQGEVNVALAPRQPGSSIKPITYEAAFLKGWTPGTIIEDAPTEFPGAPGSPPYRPKNYDGQFHGSVAARTALANSYNIPAVKALQFAGIPAVVDLARRMGITTLRDPQYQGLSLALGSGEVRLLELTGAYGVFANGGQRVPPVSILKVTDTTGALLDQYAGPHPQPVFDAAHAYLLTSILSDNQARTPAFGPNSPLKLSRPAAVKTGTTDDFRDNWTLGYTSQLVTGVWVGNADNTPMKGTTGITGAAPIWHDFMEEALKPLPVDQLPTPPGVERVAIARSSGALWTEDCADVRVEDVFAPGTAPKQRCVPTRASATPTPAGTGTPGTPVGTSTPAATAGSGTPGNPGASGPAAATGTPGSRAAAPASTPQPQPTARPPAGAATAVATAANQPKKPTATPAQRDRRPRQERR